MRMNRERISAAARRSDNGSATTKAPNKTTTLEATTTTARARRMYELLPAPELPDERTPRASTEPSSVWIWPPLPCALNTFVPVIVAFLTVALLTAVVVRPRVSTLW